MEKERVFVSNMTVIHSTQKVLSFHETNSSSKSTFSANGLGNTSEAYPDVLPPATVVSLQCLYIVALLIGVVGNGLTCSVILLRKSMRKSIHFYTFNMAICDLLILCFYVPTQILYIDHQMSWTAGLVMCKVNYIVLPLALTATVGTLLAITIDRTRGLIQPFKWRSDSKKNACIIIPIIWITSLVLTSPVFFQPKLQTYPDGMTTCQEEWPSKTYEKLYWIGNFVVLFAVPLVIIFVLHLVILIYMRKETNSLTQEQNQQMIQMTIAVVAVFAICTGSQHVYYFVQLSGSINMSLEKSATLYCFCTFVISLQAALNPIIYGTVRRDFKSAFKAMFYKAMVKMKLTEKNEHHTRAASSVASPELLRGRKNNRKSSIPLFPDFASSCEETYVGSFNSSSYQNSYVTYLLDTPLDPLPDAVLPAALRDFDEIAEKKNEWRYTTYSLLDNIPAERYATLQSLRETIL